jgi:hypothetical protein
MSRFYKNELVYHIDSGNRQFGTDNNFVINLNIPVNYICDKICLLTAYIPKTYYTCQSGYTTFTVSENGVNRTVGVSAGNYTRSTFRTTLLNSLNTSGYTGYTYSIAALNPSTVDTGLYTYTCTGNTAAFYFPILGIGDQMGFSQGNTYAFVNNTLVSTNFVNFQSENSLQIHCNCIQNYSGDDILGVLYGSGTPSAGAIIYTCPDVEGFSRRLGVLTNSINFSLTDERQIPINMNGINISFSIMLYQSIDIDFYAINFIKWFSSMYAERMQAEKAQAEADAQAAAQAEYEAQQQALAEQQAQADAAAVQPQQIEPPLVPPENINLPEGH